MTILVTEIPQMTDGGKNYDVILASSSPRRIEILEAKGFNPTIIHPQVDESIDPSTKPQEAVKILALRKAKSVYNKLTLEGFKESKNPTFIIGADTIVFTNSIIGKPTDEEDAFRILSRLRNREHFVTTGIALIELSSQQEKVFHEITRVKFKNYSDQEIHSYIKTEEPYDKAGGYAIQGQWKNQVEYIKGDYNNVVGLPWSRVSKEIRKMLRF